LLAAFTQPRILDSWQRQYWLSLPETQIDRDIVLQQAVSQDYCLLDTDTDTHTFP